MPTKAAAAMTIRLETLFIIVSLLIVLRMVRRTRSNFVLVV